MSVPPDLEAALRAVEPAVRLVSERKLRKVLIYLRDHGFALPPNPDLPLWVDRQDAVAADVLLPDTLAGTEPRLLLLTTPDDRGWHHDSPPDLLRNYWRLLYQGAVRAAIDAKLMKDALTVGRCRDRLHRLGPAAAREVEYVLETDHLADHEETAAGVYRAFAATYLDLHAFAPESLDEYFPSLPPPAEVLAVLQTDVPFGDLLPRSRPAGAADAHAPDDPATRWAEAGGATEPPPAAAREGSALLARARDAEGKGNLVRAAVLRTQAAAAGDGEPARLAAQASVGRLVEVLGHVLHWDDDTRREWRQALLPLLGPAARANWSRAARCLYELQTIPADLGREVFAVDLAEYLRTFGRRPVKRPLPHARGVMLLVRLRAAYAQLVRAGLPPREHLRLDRLFHHELHRLEHHVRHDLAPVVREALGASGFVPANRVEEVAREKVVAELLDRACERGFLRLGDLRDTVARNQLKMPDLAGPGELVFGDPLLRADTRLAHDLDGVYRRGEFYLRLLQRLSAVFFGTPWGRLLTLYVLAPFLAAYLALMMVDEVTHLGGSAGRFLSKTIAGKPRPEAEVVAPPAETFALDDDGWVVLDPQAAIDLGKQTVTSSAKAAAPEAHHGVTSPASVFCGGVFLLLVFHVPPFRRAVFAVLRAAGRALRFVLWDVPRLALRSEAVRAVRYSGPVRLFNRHLSGAVSFTAVVLVVLVLLGASPGRLLRWGLFVFAPAVVFFNTSWGWLLQERLAERLADWWRVVRVEMLPGILAAIVEAFRRLANWVERQLYAVDEWLRYRGGDSQRTLVWKALFGLLWFPVAYVTRFVFYLLFEPQVNPLKHFPVVTVSHKVIWPFLPEFAGFLTEKFLALGFEATKAEVYGGGLAAFVINGCPGIFGFIAWELKENWRLYRANRPEQLRPVLVGSHGESVRGLLRPGFHSGTVPKLYRKLRAARRRHDHDREARLHHDLEHAAECVRRFAERELVGVLAASGDWGGRGVAVSAVRFGAQRAVIELHAAGLAGTVAVAFENRDGVITAEVAATGWMGGLSERERAALLAALRGLFDMGAAARLGEHDRTPGAIPAGPLGELVRPYPWADWVARWEPKADAR
ncbi:MAG: hypothetical protein U0804_07270 [Gemmataceae bacterium]